MKYKKKVNDERNEGEEEKVNETRLDRDGRLVCPSLPCYYSPFLYLDFFGFFFRLAITTTIHVLFLQSTGTTMLFSSIVFFV